MFELRFAISGTTVYSTMAPSVPPAGSDIAIRTETYKKGMAAGTVLTFKVGDGFMAVQYDFTERPPVVYIDVNAYEVVSEGALPD